MREVYIINGYGIRAGNLQEAIEIAKDMGLL